MHCGSLQLRESERFCVYYNYSGGFVQCFREALTHCLLYSHSVLGQFWCRRGTCLLCSNSVLTCDVLFCCLLWWMTSRIYVIASAVLVTAQRLHTYLTQLTCTNLACLPSDSVVSASLIIIPHPWERCFDHRLCSLHSATLYCTSSCALHTGFAKAVSFFQWCNLLLCCSVHRFGKRIAGLCHILVSSSWQP